MLKIANCAEPNEMPHYALVVAVAVATAAAVKTVVVQQQLLLLLLVVVVVVLVVFVVVVVAVVVVVVVVFNLSFCNIENGREPLTLCLLVYSTDGICQTVWT